MSADNEIIQANQRTEDAGIIDVTVSNGANIDLVVPVSVRAHSITRSTTTLPTSASGYTAFAAQIVKPSALTPLEQMKTPAGVLQMSLDNSSWVNVPAAMCMNSDSGVDANEVASYTGVNSSQVVIVTLPVNRMWFRFLFAGVAEARFSIKYRFDGHQKVGNKNLMP